MPLEYKKWNEQKITFQFSLHNNFYNFLIFTHYFNSFPVINENMLESNLNVILFVFKPDWFTNRNIIFANNSRYYSIDSAKWQFIFDHLLNWFLKIRPWKCKQDFRLQSLGILEYNKSTQVWGIHNWYCKPYFKSLFQFSTPRIMK